MPTVTALRAHLLAAGLAGTVATTREQSLRRYRLFAARDPRVLLGVGPDRDWSAGELLALMAGRCGVCPDPAHVAGQDRIDPDLTVSALDAFAERLRAAAGEGAPVLFGTGHPNRLLGFYSAMATALEAAGCPVLTPGQGRSVEVPTRFGASRHRLRYVNGVACVQREGDRGPAQDGEADVSGVHTHSPLPLRTALAAAVAEGGPLPELVVGDHGWVCAAGRLGVESMGLADADDPAPFVGQAEGRVVVAVPVDDGVSAVHYGPLTRYVLNRARLSQ
ncbi:hypothetical protein N566_20595 [Streptomycetaceae bacterium MP113-05]|nr:hypothetical protein N566_20595 [Streptomycetaceae bacterium MP113-05]